MARLAAEMQLCETCARLAPLMEPKRCGCMICSLQDELAEVERERDRLKAECERWSSMVADMRRSS